MAFISILGKIIAPIAYVINSLLLKLFILIDEPHEKIIANLVLIIIFAIIYYSIYKIQAEINKEKVLYTPYSKDTLDFFDALYFSFVVHFTLGFGDVFPVSTSARIAVIIHTTLFWFINLIDNDLVSKLLKYFETPTPKIV